MKRSIAPITVVVLFLALPALAGEAYFSMGKLQGKSRLFGRVSEASQENNDRAQREVVTTGKALDAFGDALVAAELRAGDRPAAASERHGALTARFDLDWKALNGFVDQLVMDTDKAFVEALQRQVAVLEEREGLTLGTCEPPQGVLGMAMGESDCAGTDYTAHLVALMDEDAALEAAVDDVVSRPWPSMRPERTPLAPVALDLGGTVAAEVAWFSPAVLVDDAELFEPVSLSLDEWYRLSESQLHSFRMTMEANIELLGESDPQVVEGLDKLRKGSADLTEWREQASGEAIALAWQLADDNGDALRQELGVEALAVCLQPRDLGGCTGADRTGDVATFLSSKKKVVKAAAKHADGIIGPDLDLR